MAIKARETITIIKERDVNATWRFYRIASSASTPSQPTEAQGKAYVNNQTVPSGWNISEPAYDGTSTNSLYTCDLTSFTDGEVSWSTVSKSSSYEAAKQAYNEAQEAKKTATNYMQTVSGGVWVTPSDKKPDSSGNAISTTRGVRITDQIDIFRGTKSVAQFGEAVVIGAVESGKLNILMETEDGESGRFMFRDGQSENFGIIVNDVQFDLLGGTTTVNNDIRLTNSHIVLRSEEYLDMMYENDSMIELEPDEFYLRLRGRNSTKAYIEGYLSDDYAKGYIDVYADNWRVDEDGYFVAKGMAGMVQMFAGSTAPSGWLLCNGAAVSRTTYAALFAVIGTTYGSGDGSTTFNLPDFRNNFPVGAGSTYALNSKGGANSVTLTTNTIPAHTHGKSGAISGGITSSGAHTHTFKTQADYASKGTKKGIYSTDDGTWTGTAVMTSSGAHTHNLPAHEHTSVGGGQAHENRPPYIGINFIICTGKL